MPGRSYLLAALTFFAILLVGLPALAGDVGPQPRVLYRTMVGGADFDGLAANVSRTTDWITIDGFNAIGIYWDLDWTSGTHVNMSCQEQRRGSTAKTYNVPMCDDSVPPTSTCASLVKVWATGGADAAGRYVVRVHGYRFRCTFTVTAAAAADLLSVVFVGGVQ